MSRFYPQDLPPVPKIPKDDFFHLGITTRVMAVKQIMQIQKDMLELQNEERRNSYPQKRTFKFLSGASIPNSTIRSSMDQSENIEVHSESKSLDSNKIHPHQFIEEHTEIRQFLSEEDRGLERIRKKIKNTNTPKMLPTTTNKERRRSPLKLMDMEIPRSQRRRSTVESIKNAIEQSQPTSDIKLVNADSIEKRNLYQYMKIPTPETKTTRSPKSSIQKKDLQTQTSLVLGKIVI